MLICLDYMSLLISNCIYLQLQSCIYLQPNKFPKNWPFSHNPVILRIPNRLASRRVASSSLNFRAVSMLSRGTWPGSLGLKEVLWLNTWYMYLNPPRVWNLSPLTAKKQTGGLKLDTLGGSRYLYFADFYRYICLYLLDFYGTCM